MKKTLEAFKWVCTMFAIDTVSVVAVVGLLNESIGNPISEAGSYVFCALTICAAMYWTYYCLEKAGGKPQKKEVE